MAYSHIHSISYPLSTWSKNKVQNEVAFSLGHGVDEAESLWNMVLHTHNHSISKRLFSRNYSSRMLSFNRYKLDFSCLHIETEQELAQAIIRPAIDFKRDPWPKVLDNAKDLVKKMLNLDPKQHKQKLFLKRYMSKWKYIHFNGERVRVKRYTSDKD
ncbi:hypothetical protein ES288_D06G144100v1 [Gossypium darwinii]|uniref:Protein kinase domain-containing protein n=2 Tax=Gossypium TaxID=3633 RepID=A0A5D2KJG0_GOSTO|nr:hypothetical protein ES288_D06G144100v1 [Gossypium darwinii]TYH66795.1 hypothetical protein ES332_D06G146600v1 [Gossypium tomentosum]